jgi:hypothetical protein
MRGGGGKLRRKNSTKNGIRVGRGRCNKAFGLKLSIIIRQHQQSLSIIPVRHAFLHFRWVRDVNVLLIDAGRGREEFFRVGELLKRLSVRKRLHQTRGSSRLHDCRLVHVGAHSVGNRCGRGYRRRLQLHLRHLLHLHLLLVLVVLMLLHLNQRWLLVMTRMS